jgi:Ca2+-transporting ATPase
LKKADIGIAMGKRGTQVAREAADMVLKDDAFETIVVAIEQGRIIFNNIRKFIIYLLSCNISEILSVGVASATSLPLPLLPIQILFLNLVTDVFPALALGVGRGDKAVMGHPPRPSGEPILTRANWLAVGGYGILITGAVLGAFAWALDRLEMNLTGDVTISFLTLAFAQLFHVFNMRDRDAAVFRNEVTANPFVWAALVLCTGLLLLALYIPLFARILSLSVPDSGGWTVIVVMSLAPLVLVQGVSAAWRAISRKKA